MRTATVVMNGYVADIYRSSKVISPGDMFVHWGDRRERIVVRSDPGSVVTSLADGLAGALVIRRNPIGVIVLHQELGLLGIESAHLGYFKVVSVRSGL